MSTALAMLAAVLLDAWLGEPRRWHPLVRFGRLAVHIESRLHADRRVAGAAAWSLAVLPPVIVTALACWWLAAAHAWLAFAFQAAVLYLGIGLDLAPGVSGKNTAPQDIGATPVPHTRYLLRREIPGANVGLRKKIRGQLRARLEKLKARATPNITTSTKIGVTLVPPAKATAASAADVRVTSA